MSYQTAYEIAKAIKDILDENNLISVEFKLKALGREHTHDVKKNSNLENSAELLWSLVHKYSREYVNVKKELLATKKTLTHSTDSEKDANTDEDLEKDFDAVDLNGFLKKVNKSSELRNKQELLAELRDFRAALTLKEQVFLIVLLDRVIAEELDVELESLSANDSNTDPLSQLLSDRIKELEETIKKQEKVTSGSDNDDIFGGIEDLSGDENLFSLSSKKVKENDQKSEEINELEEDFDPFAGVEDVAYDSEEEKATLKAQAEEKARQDEEKKKKKEARRKLKEEASYVDSPTQFFKKTIGEGQQSMTLTYPNGLKN